MKLVLSSAILANTLLPTTSTTWAEGEHLSKLFLSKQRRADRRRRLGRELLVSSIDSSNNRGTAAKQESGVLKPLRNIQQRDHSSIGNRGLTKNNKKNVLEADIGLLAYQTTEGVPAFEGDNRDPTIDHRQLESYCEYLATSLGAECDCSQVATAPYEGIANCTYTREEYCYCQDMNPDSEFCFTISLDFILNGTITPDGAGSTILNSCISVGKSYLEDDTPPVVCITYGYDENLVADQACNVTVGETTCNSCYTQPYECSGCGYYDGYGGNVTMAYCFDFDCGNYAGTQATGTKVGSTCVNEFPVVTIELFLQNEWDRLMDACPADDAASPDNSTTPDDSVPDDSPTPDNTATPIVDSATPGPAPTEAPTTDGAARASSSVASLVAATGGAMMLTAWLLR